jgi:glycosyltransferase involved in cell wall biosynthesis
LLKKIASNVFLDPKLRTYDKIIANSFFTKKYAERWYQKEVTVLYPPIDTEAFHPPQKRNIILNVGRFFVGAHCKNQKDTIQVIKNLFDKNRRLLEDWEYHLAGGVTDNPRSREYLNECIREAKGYPIKFHVNTPFRSLKKLYGASRILIHATGAFENSEAHPDHMEHFGMAVAEGMSAGCVPVVVSKGGLPEIVQTGVDGFLWESEQGLKEQLLMLMTDEKMSDNMSLNSMKKSHEFSVEKFQKKLKGFIDNFD